MPSCLIEGLARTLDALEVSLDQDTLAGSAEVTTLLDALTLVPGPRRRQGCRYSFTGLLSVTATAVMCGACSLAAIVRWASGATPALLSALGLADGAAGRVPAATTFGRTLTRIDGDALDDALTAFTERLAADPLDDVVDSGVKSPAADGKTSGSAALLSERDETCAAERAMHPRCQRAGNGSCSAGSGTRLTARSRSGRPAFWPRRTGRLRSPSRGFVGREA
jgi:hypothetical protein